MVIPVGVESQTFTEVTKDKAGRVVRRPLFGVQSADGRVAGLGDDSPHVAVHFLKRLRITR